MRSWMLTRYFSLLSLVLMGMAGGALTWSVHALQVWQMEHLAQDRNVLTTRVLQNMLTTRIEAVADLAHTLPPHELAQRGEVRALIAELAPLLQDSDIAKVKIYSPQGLTIFSTETRQIGEDKSGNAGFQRAQRGEVASELTHRDEFSAFEGVRSNLDLVSSYVPVLHHGQVVAIFELYQEVTNLLADINRSRGEILALVTGVLLALFAFQWIVVRSAQVTLVAHEQHLESDRQQLGERVQAHSEALQMSQERIAHLSTHDQLTGLPNRALLFDRLQQAQRASARNHARGAIILIDLDHFSALNDTAGHELGDQVLRAVATALRATLRETDTLARLGGDEFVVVLTDQHADAGRAALAIELLAKNLLQAIAALPSSTAAPMGNFEGGASAGVALFLGQEPSGEELLKQAELAMYQSKADGRGRITFYDPAMAHQLLERTQLLADLRRALHEGEFVLHYQPEVEALGSRIVAAEALVRWQHPRRGLLAPGAFIPLAEETGLIVPLGQWVLEAACRQLALWQHRSALASLSISVNVSVQQFCHPDFCTQVLHTLQRTGADGRLLQLELTESLLAEDLGRIAATMQQLRALGLRFSLDDFGTGYSSMAYLAALPLDQLKIDQSFVREIGSGGAEQPICAAIVNLARGLGLSVVAEGVETEAQRYVLSHVHHCDLLQGYLISRPIPATDLEALVQWKHADALSQTVST